MATARIAGLMFFAGVLSIALVAEARAQVVVPHGGRVVVAPTAVRSVQRGVCAFWRGAAQF